MNPGTGWVCGGLCLLVLGAAPADVSGQPIREQWPGLRGSALPTVYVQTETGTETSGKLLALSPDSLVLLVDGVERRFDAADVRRVEKRDSIRNGTIIGALAGVVMGAVSAGISDCPGERPGGYCGGLRTVLVGLSVGTYAALGAGVDAVIRGRTTIYQAPRRVPTGASTAGSPLAPALRVAVSW
jgi:hypothetical protein